MLMDLINLLEENEIYSNTTIAGKLGVNNDMLKQMLNELLRLGYVENINLPLIANECSTGKCRSCSINCGPSGPAESRNGIWMLTEEGKKSAEKNIKGR